MGTVVSKVAAGTLVLALVLGSAVWVFRQVFAVREASRTQREPQTQESWSFEYTATAEAGHIRVNGTASFPNGVILVGTLDKVGSGQIELKEALVMNRLFIMEFGPELYVQYYLQGMQNALQAGMYRLTVEFDPSQQSPFARESLSRSPLVKASPAPEDGSREVDSASMRVSKTFAIGTTAEQEEIRVREQQYQQMIRQRLSDALGSLTQFWERLYARYQQERLKGGFSRTDSRAGDWQTWSAQWLNDVKDFGETAQLDEMASPASPYYPAREALVTVHRQLIVMSGLYFEVLANERSLTDRELQHTEQIVQYALGDAMAQLGQPESVSFPAKGERVKPAVIVLSPLVNVRSGPGIQYESIRQVKKDDVLDLLGERGEWFHVQLGGERTGWVHRNVASKRTQGDGTIEDVKPLTADKGARPQLEPIQLLSTPIEFIPSPTSDEVKIYGEMEQQLRGLQAVISEERRAVEQRILQRMSDKHGISPEQVWNTYLKVQGWQLRP